MEIRVPTDARRQVIDITNIIAGAVHGKREGIVTVFASHTTAAITTADLDPGTDLDLLDALEGLLPKRQWRHPHDPHHAPDHLLASIIGPSVCVPFRDGRLMLGVWQRIVLVDFDGPRERTINIQIFEQQLVS